MAIDTSHLITEEGKAQLKRLEADPELRKQCEIVWNEFMPQSPWPKQLAMLMWNGLEGFLGGAAGSGRDILSPYTSTGVRKRCTRRCSAGIAEQMMRGSSTR